MRNFAILKDIVRFPSNTSILEGEPIFEAPAFVDCLHESMLDGSIMYRDMTSVLQDVDKYISRVGPSVVQDLILQLQPKPLQTMDSLTDSQRFECIVSRHCQTISERSQLLEYLSNNHSDLVSRYQMEVKEDSPAGNAVALSSESNE